jgi:hypothetical protein
MNTRGAASVLVCVLASVAAGPVHADAFVPVSAFDPSGALDADLARALDDAAALAATKPADAIDAVILVAASQDRFTVAQRSAWSARAAQILVDAAATASARGDVALAARACDAAAALDPARKSEGARALLAWARADASLTAPQKLGVVRRALALDPRNDDVMAEDDALSANGLFLPGAALMGVGVAWQIGTIAVPVAVGQTGGELPIPEDLTGLALIGSLAFGGAIIGAGAALGFAGVPDPPQLPDALPALE